MSDPNVIAMEEGEEFDATEALSSMGGRVREEEVAKLQDRVATVLSRHGQDTLSAHWHSLEWDRLSREEREHNLALSNRTSDKVVLAPLSPSNGGEDDENKTKQFNETVVKRLPDLLTDVLGGKRWRNKFKQRILGSLAQVLDEPGWRHGFRLLDSQAQKRVEMELDKFESNEEDMINLMRPHIFDLLLTSRFTLQTDDSRSYAEWVTEELLFGNEAFMDACKRYLGKGAKDDEEEDEISMSSAIVSGLPGVVLGSSAMLETGKKEKGSKGRRKAGWGSYPWSFKEWQERIFAYLKPELHHVWAKLPWEELYKDEERHDRRRRSSDKPDQKNEDEDILHLAPASRETFLRLSNKVNNKNETMEEFDIDSFRNKQMEAFQREFLISGERDKLLRAFFFYYMMKSPVTATTRTNTLEYYNTTTYAEFLLENLFESETVLKGCTNRKKPSFRRKGSSSTPRKFLQTITKRNSGTKSTLASSSSSFSAEADDDDDDVGVTSLTVFTNADAASDADATMSEAGASTSLPSPSKKSRKRSGAEPSSKRAKRQKSSDASSGGGVLTVASFQAVAAAMEKNFKKILKRLNEIAEKVDSNASVLDNLSDHVAKMSATASNRTDAPPPVLSSSSSSSSVDAGSSGNSTLEDRLHQIETHHGLVFEKMGGLTKRVGSVENQLALMSRSI